MCSTSPATPTSATWSVGVPRDGVPAGAASARCRSAASTPGRRGNRSRGGPGWRSATASGGRCGSTPWRCGGGPRGGGGAGRGGGWGGVGPEERLVVMRTVEAAARTDYSLSNAGPEVPLSELVRVRFTRHRIEEVFGAAKGEVGLGQYEVRSWVGWHHHMTLSLVALWFLVLERIRVGGENRGRDRVAGAGDLHPAATVAGPEPRADRGGRHPRAVAEGGGADRQVAQGDRNVPAAPLPAGHELNSCAFV